MKTQYSTQSWSITLHTEVSIIISRSLHHQLPYQLKGTCHLSSLPPPSVTIFSQAEAQGRVGNLRIKSQPFRNLFTCCHKIVFLFLCKNDKVTGNDQSLSSAPAAMPGVITDPVWDTDRGLCPTPGQPHCITKGICSELCPCPRQFQFSLWIAGKSQQPRNQCRLFSLAAGDPGWWPGDLPEPRSIRQHPHCAITCWLRHISTPCRATSDCTAAVSQTPASQAAWNTGAAHSVLLTCTTVMNSEPANWNINDLVNYRKEPTHSEVCSTIAWLFGMMNTHNSSKFQQEVRTFALL